MNPQILKLALWGVPLKRRIKQKIIFRGIQLLNNAASKQ